MLRRRINLDQQFLSEFGAVFRRHITQPVQVKLRFNAFVFDFRQPLNQLFQALEECEDLPNSPSS